MPNDGPQLLYQLLYCMVVPDVCGYAPRIVFWKHKTFQLRFSALLVATYMLDVQPALQ